MKEPYTKSRFLSKRFRGYFDLIRPFTLTAPLFVSMFIMFASLVYNDRFSDFPNWWITIGQASLTLVFLNAASNALNQATDAEADMISKPYRPIPRGIVKPEEAQSIAYLFYLFALLRAVTINIWFGVFVFFIMIFTVTYSLPPRMKRFLFFNQVWIAVPRGFLGILASWSVFGDPMQKEPLVIGTIAFLFLIGAMTTKDIVDSEADKRTGTRTLINTFGIKKAAMISLPFMFLPFALVPLLVGYDILSYYFLPLSLFTITSLIVFYLLIKGEENKALENVRAWSFMYIEYLFFAMGFTLLIIFGEMGSLTFLSG
jgi:geranylgeranylglycerol-phosphate geranylgeranyltransferase